MSLELGCLTDVIEQPEAVIGLVNVVPRTVELPRFGEVTFDTGDGILHAATGLEVGVALRAAACGATGTFAPTGLPWDGEQHGRELSRCPKCLALYPLGYIGPTTQP
jgi:hypothetical protein